MGYYKVDFNSVIPNYSLWLSNVMKSNNLLACNKAAPPPGNTPLIIVFLVAFRLSIILSLFSCISTSDLPPTYKIADFPPNLFILSFNI